MTDAFDTDPEAAVASLLASLPDYARMPADARPALPDLDVYRSVVEAQERVGDIKREALDRESAFLAKVHPRFASPEQPIVEVLTAEELAELEAIQRRYLQGERALAAIYAWHQRVGMAFPDLAAEFPGMTGELPQPDLLEDPEGGLMFRVPRPEDDEDDA